MRAEVQKHDLLRQGKNGTRFLTKNISVLFLLYISYKPYDINKLISSKKYFFYKKETNFRKTLISRCYF